MNDERRQELAREAVALFTVERKGESFVNHDNGRTREDGTHSGDLMQLTRSAAERVVDVSIEKAASEAMEPDRKRIEAYARFVARVANQIEDSSVDKSLKFLDAELHVIDSEHKE